MAMKRGVGKLRGVRLGLALGLTAAHARKLAALKTPERIQDFIDAIPMNHEPDGDSCTSVIQTLRRRRAHCIEAVFVAACALWMQGRPPLVMDMQAIAVDDDHVIALFKRGRHWGAISKSNHVTLRFRDAIYRSPRELAMSYFHEYCKNHVKTLKAYSIPVDMRRFAPARWVMAKDACWDVAEELDGVRHFQLLTAAQRAQLRHRDGLEVRVGRVEEYPKPRKRKRATARNGRRP